MRFEILIYNNAEFESAIEGPDADPAIVAEWSRAHADLQTELRKSGELLDSNELSPQTAVVVRADRGTPHRVKAVDGPFSESKEWVGGFYVVDCATVDRAVEIAGRFVEARYSPVEVRQLVHPGA
ncbi:YciI family protein [Leifsonia sp. NPDC058248]|uniref:YciI family protein n=1 Tax=Leifsonia sp. NPDC058248 TaxID=3346402 RepID=UPI0036DEB164